MKTSNRADEDSLLLSEAEKEAEMDKGGCCAEGDNPPDGPQQGCVESWEDKKKDAANQLEIASALAEQAKQEFESAIQWESNLRVWLDDAGKAHEKVQLVSDLLQGFRAVTNRLEGNTAKAAVAIRALICQVKRTFDSIRHVLDGDVGELQLLRDYIDDDLKDLDEKKKFEARKCTESYETQMLAVHGLQASLLTKLLEILRSADQLVAAIDNKRGLTWQIKDLEDRFAGDTTTNARTAKCGCHGGAPTPPAAPPSPPCGKEISKPSAVLFPIKVIEKPTSATQQQQTMKPQVSAYYAELEKWYEVAVATSEANRGRLRQEKQKKDAALARKSSLEEAIKAAEAAAKAK